MSRPTTITEPTDLLTLREDLTLPEIERRAGVIYAGTGLRHRALAHYLHLVDRRGLYQTAGYRTAAQWAAGRLGMSTREARDLLAAGRALPELPLIDRAFAEGRLWWTKVRQLIKVATPQHEQEWLRKACELTSDELVLEVRLSRAGQAPRSRDDRKGLPEVRLQLGASMPPDVYAMWEQVRRKATDEAGRRTQEWECLEAAFRAYLSTSDDGTQRGATNSPYTVIVNDSPDSQLDTEVDTEDGPVPVGELTRRVLRCDGHHRSHDRANGKGKDEIPAWLRRRVLARDRHRCRRCASRDSLHLHHIIPEEFGGPTEYDNLVVLCRYCHTLVHGEFIQDQWQREERPSLR